MATTQAHPLPVHGMQTRDPQATGAQPTGVEPLHPGPHAPRHDQYNAPERTRHPERINVGETERLLSALGGVALGLIGLSRGNLAGLGLAGIGGALVYRGMTGHCHLYQAAGLNTASESTGAAVPAYRGFKVTQAMTINKSPEELFRFWRNFENLPRFMTYLESVKVEGNRSHWVCRGPLGMTVSWDAEIYNERPNEMIAWQTLPGSTVASAGSVHFTPAAGGRGTEVRVTLKYDPPGGSLGAWFAWLVGSDPASLVREDLRRFKSLMEAGEIPTVTGQTSGRLTSAS